MVGQDTITKNLNLLFEAGLLTIVSFSDGFVQGTSLTTMQVGRQGKEERIKIRAFWGFGACEQNNNTNFSSSKPWLCIMYDMTANVINSYCWVVMNSRSSCVSLCCEATKTKTPMHLKDQHMYCDRSFHQLCLMHVLT